MGDPTKNGLVHYQCFTDACSMNFCGSGECLLDSSSDLGYLCKCPNGTIDQDCGGKCYILLYTYQNSHLSRLVGKPTMWFPNRSDINRPVQSQKRARSLKFSILVEEELYYPSRENKGADQLRGYREADLRLCFRLCRLLVFP